MTPTTNGNSTTVGSSSSSSIVVSELPIKVPEPSILTKCLAYTIFNLLSLPMIAVFSVLRGKSVMLHLWRLARQPAIDYNNIGESDLVEKALTLPTAKVYLNENALEYQLREGYCAVATQRNILKSIPGFPKDKVPCPKKGGPSTASAFCESLTNISGYAAKVVLGSEGYDAFVQALRKSNESSQCRVAVNFLRSSMFGIKRPAWLPTSLLLTFVGGHFSPVLGFLEKENLVAIFDTNHKYGFYLCDAKRLFDAVNTVDVMSGSTRGIIVVDIATQKEE